MLLVQNGPIVARGAQACPLRPAARSSQAARAASTLTKARLAVAPSFDTLYRKHAPSVFRRARQLLGSAADADEIVQDLFLSLLERPEQFSGQSSLATWLYSATTHACLNRLRNVKNRARLLATHCPEDHDVVPPRADERSNLRQVLHRMPPQLAEVAVYYFHDELTQEEIAELMGCSRRHVGNLAERVLAWGREQRECVRTESGA